jgi:putative ABC transport system ATP-binding protein
MSEPVVCLEHVTKRYVEDPDAPAALDDVTLSVARGEFLGIMGQSGSGKSTLLNLVGGLDRSYEGRVNVLGHDFATLKDRELARLRNRSLGFVFQAYHLMPRLSCAENVALPVVFHPKRLDDLDARVERVLERVGLRDKAREHPGRLSGGQKQRVAIARAMLLEPELLLCDEPTGNLDRGTGGDLVDALRQMSKSAGLTVLVVTHEEYVGAACDRIVHLRAGRLSDPSDSASNGRARPPVGPDASERLS